MEKIVRLEARTYQYSKGGGRKRGRSRHREFVGLSLRLNLFPQFKGHSWTDPYEETNIFPFTKVLTL